jgi:hypothetical protein
MLFNYRQAVCAMVWYESSELERYVGVQLSVEVSVLLVVQPLVVPLGLLQALGIGLSEDVVGQYPLAETSVAGQRVAQLHVLFALLLDQLGVHPLVILRRQRFPELLVLRECELIDFLSRVFNGRLHVKLLTSLTTILVLGTPTMSAAVRWSRSEGGMWDVVWEVMYLCLASKSCPFTKLVFPTSRVVLPKVLP